MFISIKIMPWNKNCGYLHGLLMGLLRMLSKTATGSLSEEKFINFGKTRRILKHKLRKIPVAQIKLLIIRYKLHSVVLNRPKTSRSTNISIRKCLLLLEDGLKLNKVTSRKRNLLEKLLLKRLTNPNFKV